MVEHEIPHPAAVRVLMERAIRLERMIWLLTFVLIFMLIIGSALIWIVFNALGRQQAVIAQITAAQESQIRINEKQGSVNDLVLKIIKDKTSNRTGSKIGSRKGDR